MQILSAPPEIELDSIDQRVYMNLRWEQFEAFLRARGDTSANRIAYLDGVLEIMSPSDNHEVIKKNIARLLEAWALREDVELEGYGSWTLKQRRKKSGVEPDECYFRGPRAGRKVPDLALEVVWTTGGTDKLEIYRRLGTREVWIWEAGAIRVFCLGASGYTRFTRSSVLPELDVRLLSRYCTRPDQHRAVKAFLRALSKH
ncbi:MAG: Uma2 family endonuclease [Myxococcaceae bacterium]